jgi:hypothetical protein
MVVFTTDCLYFFSALELQSGVSVDWVKPYRRQNHPSGYPPGEKIHTTILLLGLLVNSRTSARFYIKELLT